MIKKKSRYRLNYLIYLIYHRLCNQTCIIMCKWKSKCKMWLVNKKAASAILTSTIKVKS